VRKCKVTQVYVNDGSALYVDGKLISNSFTCGESRLLEALGYTDVESVRANDKYYAKHIWPTDLEDIVK
jgi:hypothetical protein